MAEQGSGREEVFLSAKQIADRYGCSKQWPYHDRELAKLRIQAGRRVFWKLSDLEALEAQESGRGFVLALFKRWELERKRKLIKFEIA